MEALWERAAVRESQPESEKIGEYEFRRNRSMRLGSGSYAVVYIGRHLLVSIIINNCMTVFIEFMVLVYFMGYYGTNF